MSELLKNLGSIGRVLRVGKFFLSGKMKYLTMLFVMLGGGSAVTGMVTDKGSALVDETWMKGLELIGNSKKDILVDRVTAAKDSQQEVAETFTSALEEFKALTGFDGGELETKYNRLNDAYERSKGAADKIRKHNTKVARASDRMLNEWRDELDEYTDRTIKRKSQEKLQATQKHCERLIDALMAAEERIKPVEQSLKEHVLFLKHNLNSEALASLDGELEKVSTDVDLLIDDMQASIDEATELINDLESPEA